MTIVKVSDLKTGDIIKSYEIFSDEKWHFVRDVGSGSKSKIYLALEDFGSGQFDPQREVERKD